MYRQCKRAVFAVAATIFQAFQPLTEKIAIDLP
jgi:hypothetical protein